MACRSVSVYSTYPDTRLPFLGAIIKACFEVDKLFCSWTEHGPKQLIGSNSCPCVAVLTVGTSCVLPTKACFEVDSLFRSQIEHGPMQPCAQPPSVNRKDRGQFGTRASMWYTRPCGRKAWWSQSWRRQSFSLCHQFKEEPPFIDKKSDKQWLWNCKQKRHTMDCDSVDCFGMNWRWSLSLHHVLSMLEKTGTDSMQSAVQMKS